MDMSQFNAAEQATLAKAIEAKQVSAPDSLIADGVLPPLLCFKSSASRYWHCILLL